MGECGEQTITFSRWKSRKYLQTKPNFPKTIEMLIPIRAKRNRFLKIKHLHGSRLPDSITRRILNLTKITHN